MTEIDLNGINKQIHNVLKENKRLQSLKERYIAHGAKVNALADSLHAITLDLRDLAKDLDPIIKVSDRSRMSLKQHLTDLYEQIANGMTLTTKKIASIYPKLDDRQVSQLLQRLSNMPRIAKRKDGRTAILYYEPDS